MKVLGIDTSSNVLGVAVLDEDGGSVEFNYALGLRHASHLVPTIKEALRFAGLSLKEIDAYCVSIGPGSFTGLRIGVSTIKALWLVNKKKVVAVPTLDALARNIPYTQDTICVIVDAKKEKLYAGFYRYRLSNPPHPGPLPFGERVQGEGAFLLGYQELLNRLGRMKNGILLVGDGIPSLRASPVGASEAISKKRDCFGHLRWPRNDVTIRFASEEFWYPRAINVARLGLQMLKKGKVVKDVDALVPVYLHPKDVQCRR